MKKSSLRDKIPGEGPPKSAGSHGSSLVYRGLRHHICGLLEQQECNCIVFMQTVSTNSSTKVGGFCYKHYSGFDFMQLLLKRNEEPNF